MTCIMTDEQHNLNFKLFSYIFLSLQIDKTYIFSLKRLKLLFIPANSIRIIST